jgi:putative spermidine/putrescine transport system permease protein
VKPRHALAAYVLLFFLFVMAPILIVVVVSFSSHAFVSFPIEGFSLRWYYRIWEYRPFVDSLLVSIELGVCATVAACVLGIPAALSIGRSRSGLGEAASVFLLSPLSMPLIILGFVLLFYCSRIGLGVSFASLVVAHTIVSLPYVVRSVVSVYRSAPRASEEAAAILGADPLRAFLHVVLPAIRPGVMNGAAFSMLISLDNLPVSYFFGSATTNTLPVVMLSYMQYQFDPSIAALSTVQLGLAVIVLWLLGRWGGLDRPPVLQD